MLSVLIALASGAGSHDPETSPRGGGGGCRVCTLRRRALGTGGGPWGGVWGRGYFVGPCECQRALTLSLRFLICALGRTVPTQACEEQQTRRLRGTCRQRAGGQRLLLPRLSRGLRSFSTPLPSAPNLSLYCREEGQVSDFRAPVTCCSWVTVTWGWHSVQGGPRLREGAGTGQQGAGRRSCLLDIESGDELCSSFLGVEPTTVSTWEVHELQKQ